MTDRTTEGASVRIAALDARLGVRAFLRAGVSSLSAEPVPFSRFSADETALYPYRAADA